MTYSVIPAKAGIQFRFRASSHLDAGFRRHDEIENTSPNL
jgi:hypothetical protein